MIKEFGGKVESVWEGLRPVTKSMLEGALQAGKSSILNPKTPKFFYDAHADFEVSRLLSALDERSKSKEVRKDAVKLGELNQLADICVLVLESQSASAEVFIQLAERAIMTTITIVSTNSVIIWPRDIQPVRSLRSSGRPKCRRSGPSPMKPWR